MQDLIKIKYGDCKFIMINLFGEEEFKPLIRYGTVIPDYYISEDGRLYSAKTNKFRKPVTNYYWTATGEKRIKNQQWIVSFSDPELFDDFEYTCKEGKNIYELNIKCHRAVAETWKPIDQFPPVPIKDWEQTPESVKDIIKATLIVDHLDDDPTNNHANNLGWVIPKDNQHIRKKHKLNLE